MLIQLKSVLVLGKFAFDAFLLTLKKTGNRD